MHIKLVGDSRPLQMQHATKAYMRNGTVLQRCGVGLMMVEQHLINPQLDGPD